MNSQKEQAGPAISTHALTEGDGRGGKGSQGRDISTHALTEGDDNAAGALPYPLVFQLTPSRRATRRTPEEAAAQDISTHALTEGDRFVFLMI